MSSSSMAESRVAGIVKTLSSLEDDMDSMNSRISEIQKSINSKTQAELASLMGKTQEIAAAEASSIIDTAKSKAKAEATKIAEAGQARLSETQSRIDASFDEAVDIVVSTVLKA